jgi:hypothetical protein
MKGSWLVVLLFPAAGSAHGQSKPNIVLVLMDNLAMEKSAFTAAASCVGHQLLALTNRPAKDCDYSISTSRLNAHRVAPRL